MYIILNYTEAFLLSSRGHSTFSAPSFFAISSKDQASFTLISRICHFKVSETVFNHERKVREVTTANRDPFSGLLLSKTITSLLLSSCEANFIFLLRGSGLHWNSPPDPSMLFWQFSLMIDHVDPSPFGVVLSPWHRAMMSAQPYFYTKLKYLVKSQNSW